MLKQWLGGIKSSQLSERDTLPLSRLFEAKPKLDGFEGFLEDLRIAIGAFLRSIELPWQPFIGGIYRRQHLRHVILVVVEKASPAMGEDGALRHGVPLSQIPRRMTELLAELVQISSLSVQ